MPAIGLESAAARPYFRGHRATHRPGVSSREIKTFEFSDPPTLTEFVPGRPIIDSDPEGLKLDAPAELLVRTMGVERIELRWKRSGDII